MNELEILLTILIGSMIVGALYALHARDLLSAVISLGVVGYSLVICFLLLKAPDLAMVQVVIETITLIIMIAVVLDSSRKEFDASGQIIITGESYFATKRLLRMGIALVAAGLLLFFFSQAIELLEPLGQHTTRMSSSYIQEANQTGSANLVTGVLFDFRGYDTLGETAVVFTAAIGVMSVLGLRRRKRKGAPGMTDKPPKESE